MQQSLIELVLVFTLFRHGRNVCAIWHMLWSSLNLTGDAVFLCLCISFITGQHHISCCQSLHHTSQTRWLSKQKGIRLKGTTWIIQPRLPIYISSIRLASGGLLIWVCLHLSLFFFLIRLQTQNGSQFSAPVMAILRTRFEMGFNSDFA